MADSKLAECVEILNGVGVRTTEKELLGRNRETEVLIKRCYAAHILWKHRGLTFAAISDELNLANHTCVMHLIKSTLPRLTNKYPHVKHKLLEIDSQASIMSKEDRINYHLTELKKLGYEFQQTHKNIEVPQF